MCVFVSMGGEGGRDGRGWGLVIVLMMGAGECLVRRFQSQGPGIFGINTKLQH